MGFPPIAERPEQGFPAQGQPYHAWWTEKPAPQQQRNPYGEGPIRSVRGATPGSRSTSTATTATKSSRRTASTGSSGAASYRGPNRGAPRSNQYGGGGSQSARNAASSGAHAQALQERVNATLRELEEIKAGTHSVCIAPPRTAPRVAPPQRVVPVTPRRYVEPVVTARRPVPAQEPGRPTSVPVVLEPQPQPQHAVANGDRLARRRGRAPVVAAPAPMMSGRRDVAATAPAAASKAHGMTLDGLLTEAGLGQYGVVLAQNGMDVPAVLGCTAMQLQQMGMKMGHALRLLNTASRLQGGEGLSAPASTARQIPAVSAAGPSGATKQGEWSEEEDDALLKARAIYGGRWDAIAGTIPGRSKEDCRRRWEHSGTDGNGGTVGLAARASTSASTGVSSSIGAPTPMLMPPAQHHLHLHHHHQQQQQHRVGPGGSGKAMDSRKKETVQSELEAALAQLEAEAEMADGSMDRPGAGGGGTGQYNAPGDGVVYQRRRADAAAVVRCLAAGGPSAAGPTSVYAATAPALDESVDAEDILALADAALRSAMKG